MVAMAAATTPTTHTTVAEVVRRANRVVTAVTANAAKSARKKATVRGAARNGSTKATTTTCAIPLEVAVAVDAAMVGVVAAAGVATLALLTPTAWILTGTLIPAPRTTLQASWRN